MPELPEVETVRRTLVPYITGRIVHDVLVYWEGALVDMSVKELKERLIGGRFCGTLRRGKYLGLQIEDRGYLVVHLRMTGRLLARPQKTPPDKHLRVLISLDGPYELHFVDQRKFGKVYWAVDEEAFTRIAHVGPEPLSDEFSPEQLASALAKSQSKIKAKLLDQAVVAGLGNIYVDESLFRAGIHPEREAASLTQEEIESLWESIRVSLQAGIEHGGTTLRDYVDSNGRQGENQNFLLVYGKAGSPCVKCGSTLVRSRVGGRGTTFCPHCQS